VSSKREGDTVFWTDLNKSCFNDITGHAFYCYLTEIDLTNFNSQNFPITNNKMDSINKRLDTVELFLKENYILQNLNINCSIQDLFDSYTMFCTTIVKKPYNKIDFNKHLSTLNIIHYKSNSIRKYKISHEELMIIANKKHWIHSLDDFNTDNIIEEEKIDYKSLYENSQKELEQLKLSLKPKTVIKSELELLEEELNNLI
jgi:hypothetical protein